MRFELTKINQDSFRVFQYGLFREVGLIDVAVRFNPEGTEQDLDRHQDPEQVLTLAFYRSSGTNSGKIEGQWYPILGIKTTSGPFNQGSSVVNKVSTLSHGVMKKGWLMKSVFFTKSFYHTYEEALDGYSYTPFARPLKSIADYLANLYEEGHYSRGEAVDSDVLSTIKDYNQQLYSTEVKPGNRHSQIELLDCFLRRIRDYLIATV